MKKITMKQRFQYWFDNQMAKGTGTLIRILLLCSVGIVLLLVILMTVLTRKNGFFANLWNGFVTMINAWMPEYDPADPPDILSLIFTALIAVYGILFTSVLIGIVTNLIEEKVISLRRGNSVVLEEEHSVILGFTPGEYTLLEEIILSFGKEPGVIVVAGETDKEDMEEMIRDNVTVPKHLKVICRSLDIFDPVELERLSVKKAEEIIVSAMPNEQVTKVLLALAALIDENDPVRISAILYKEEYRLPESYARKHRIYTLQTNDTIASMMARACVQPGLSKVLVEVFDFSGDEFYLEPIAGIDGMTFAELSARLDYASVLGYMRSGNMFLNPDMNAVLKEGDRIALFTPEKDSWKMREVQDTSLPEALREKANLARNKTKVCIVGYNRTLKMILRQLPYSVNEVMLVNPMEEEELIEELREEFRYLTIRVSRFRQFNEAAILKMAEEYHHFVLLSRHSEDEDNDDMLTSFLLLRMRDVRERYQLEFNITAEMRTGFNQNLIADDDHTDFIVASNMASRFLAQLSQNNELLPLFREILSNQGNEIQLIRAEQFHLNGSYSIAQLRHLALINGFVFMGYIDENEQYQFNPPLTAAADLKGTDRLILIGSC